MGTRYPKTRDAIDQRQRDLRPGGVSAELSAVRKHEIRSYLELITMLLDEMDETDQKTADQINHPRGHFPESRDALYKLLEALPQARRNGEITDEMERHVKEVLATLKQQMDDVDANVP